MNSLDSKTLIAHAVALHQADKLAQAEQSIGSCWRRGRDIRK